MNSRSSLHQLIVDELASIVAVTSSNNSSSSGGVGSMLSSPDSKNSSSNSGSLFDTDPIAKKLLTQCPPLPQIKGLTNGSHVPATTKKSKRSTLRHQNGILGLAKLLRDSTDAAVRRELFDRLSLYISVISLYSYEECTRWLGDGSSEQHFAQKLISRLLDTANQDAELGREIMTSIWDFFNKLLDCALHSPTGHACVFAIPSILGSIEALESTKYRFEGQDILEAKNIGNRLVSSRFSDAVHRAVNQAGQNTTTRRLVRHYMQQGFIVSSTMILSRYFLALRSILESLVARTLVSMGTLSFQQIFDKNPKELWQSMAGLEISKDRSLQPTELSDSYQQLYQISSLSFSEMHNIAERSLDPENKQLIPESSIDEAVNFMCRCLYVSTLLCVQLNQLDEDLLKTILGHIKGPTAHKFTRLTIVCFRVIPIITTFFRFSIRPIMQELITYITNPSDMSCDPTIYEFMIPRLDNLIDPATEALVYCLKLETRNEADTSLVTGTMHTMVSALANYSARRQLSAFEANKAERVHRNMILAITHIAVLYQNESIILFARNMIRTSKVNTFKQLRPLLLESILEMAPYADHETYTDIVKESLKYMATSSDSRDGKRLRQGICKCLIRLAPNIANRKDFSEDLFTASVRSFLDQSVKVASERPTSSASTPSEGEIDVLELYMPIIEASLRSPHFGSQKRMDDDMVSLFRNFWFHMVLRGYVTHPACVSKFEPIYMFIAVMSPIIVLPTSTNYLEAEIDMNAITKGATLEPSQLLTLKQKLNSIAPSQATLVKSLGVPQVVFLLSVYYIESARTKAGDFGTFLKYFSNKGVLSSRLLPIFDSFGDYIINLFVAEFSSKKPTVFPAKSPRSLDSRAGTNDLAIDTLSPNRSIRSYNLKHLLRELLKDCCHHLEQVSRWSRMYVNRLIGAFSQVLLDKEAITILLEMLHLVWLSCKSELDSQPEPVYWFTSKKINISLQLPDSISYRKSLYRELSISARQWLEKSAQSAPMEMESLLQMYLVSHVDESLSFEPHVGHAMALDVGRTIRHSNTYYLGRRDAAFLADNSSPFLYKLGELCYVAGHQLVPSDIQELKQELAVIYQDARDSPYSHREHEQGHTRTAVLLSRITRIIVHQNKPDPELLRLLIWVPLVLSKETIMRSAIYQWTTVVIERPALELLILVELTIAWSWMIQKQLGLFSRRFQHKNPFDAKVLYAPSDKSARSRAHDEILGMLAPQVLLIEFLTHRFDATRHQLHYPDVVKPMIQILQQTFKHNDRLSTNSLSRNARFQLINLGFKLLRVGFNNSVMEANFREGLYNLAFTWFMSSPLWSFSGNITSIVSEIRVLVQTRQALNNDHPVLKSGPTTVHSWGDVPRSSDQPTPLHGQQSQLDSRRASNSSFDKNRDAKILNTLREKLKIRVQYNKEVLLLLLDSEISRLSTWVNPTKQVLPYLSGITNVDREPNLTDNSWSIMVKNAWAVSPKLALQLPKRFTATAITKQLSQLIHQYPGDLVDEPDALKYLLDHELPTSSFPTLAPGVGTTTDLTTGSANSFRENKFLLYWAPVSPITATTYFALPSLSNPFMQQYSMRSLASFPVDITFFYIPQLVQALRNDTNGYIAKSILEAASISQLFAHQIIWNMEANMYKDESAKEPDSLKPTLVSMIDRIVGQLSGDDQEFYIREFTFFKEVTGISGKLKPYIKKSKEEKKKKIDEEMRKIKVEKDVYLPSNPEATVIDIDYTSGRPLQSHAKAPFMATFYIRKRTEEEDQVQELMSSGTSGGTSSPNDAQSYADFSEHANQKNEPSVAKVNNGGYSSNVQYLASRERAPQVVRAKSTMASLAPDSIGIEGYTGNTPRGSIDHAYRPNLGDVLESGRNQNQLTASVKGTMAVAHHSKSHSPPIAYKDTKLSAIFKVGDDCRQDVLALQLIALFKNIFSSCGLDLYLFPYRVVATAPGCGVIDVIPKSISRDQLGREKVNSLYDYFSTKFGGVDSILFQKARNNFVQSCAAYSVLSYILQFKDRHNGNIMIDDEGHVIHIDFGFILDIAPGGITFENAPFKLTTEYIDVMGGGPDAQPFQLFRELCVKAYLASRPYAEQIIQVVGLMIDSGLPCFKGETLANLRLRFQVDRTESEAAQYMMDRINDSYENRRTVLYDTFQKVTNDIPY
ncbi:phosphatidylinositol-4- kinase [Mycoemilia scoparia]|uniref:1-phosphatidylinositol 4-kinase n=1 Tax=Mycoemilia scoparia TaxID=417184 RepID=A0A9W7ZND2_9FUNG|nr:phosphatidylinositol-4- kinase [Mycoemilia scoparia]